MKSTAFLIVWLLSGMFIMSDASSNAGELSSADVFGGFIAKSDGEYCCDTACQGCQADHGCTLVGSKCIERVQLGLNKACFEERGPGCNTMAPCYTEELTGVGSECQDIVKIAVPPGGCGIDSCVDGTATQCGIRTTCAED